MKITETKLIAADSAPSDYDSARVCCRRRSTSPESHVVSLKWDSHDTEQ